MRKRESIVEVLMRRDGHSRAEAEDLVEDAKEELQQLLQEGDIAGAEKICAVHFGLEPDYLDDLM